MVGRRLLAMTCLALILPSRAAAEIRDLSLYEKVGRAPLVVWGEVSDGEHRFAGIRTLEVIKCAIPERPGDGFRIAFRLDSFLRAPWQDKIEFKDGERLLLFLRKFTKEDGEKPEGDVYTLVGGATGRYLLPPEGEEAHVAAARAFAAISGQQDLDLQARMLKDAIQDKNPILAEGAFDEMLKQGLGDLAMVPSLTPFFDSPREAIRLRAIRLLRQILQDARVAGRTVPGREELTDMVRGRAAADASESFRVEAVMTLRELGGESVKAFLARVAKEDPSQLVRYEAEKSLMGWKDGP